MKRIVLVSALITFILLSAPLFAKGSQETGDESLSVYTSILPQKYFVEKIGGDRVSVKVLVSPGKNPATYEPTPQQVVGLGSAKILFTIGVAFENAFLPTIKGSLTSLTICDTSEGISKRMLESHSHDEEDEHEEETSVPDPHIWLSPELVKIQAANIQKALVKADPEGQNEYQNGYELLIKELEEVQKELNDILAPYNGNTLFVYHPAFGYLADEYGLKQVAIETGGKEPVPTVLEEIIEHAQEEQVKIIFVQPEFSIASARSIAKAIDGSVVTLNPLNPDYINNLKSISAAIQEAYWK